jgi:hypothetical protein
MRDEGLRASPVRLVPDLDALDKFDPRRHLLTRVERLSEDSKIQSELFARYAAMLEVVRFQMTHFPSSLPASPRGLLPEHLKTGDADLKEMICAASDHRAMHAGFEAAFRSADRAALGAKKKMEDKQSVRRDVSAHTTALEKLRASVRSNVPLLERFDKLVGPLTAQHLVLKTNNEGSIAVHAQSDNLASDCRRILLIDGGPELLRCLATASPSITSTELPPLRDKLSDPARLRSGASSGYRRGQAGLGE